ncbi:MAG TPA: chromate transporter [Erysipelotrichaceae bacterium]|nr:chromate transporter [Erysipelotrichaceae bacterium]
MSEFIRLCIEFFKTGLFAVGGGLASIPFLKEMAVKYGWFTIEDLTTMIAVSESTPGPIGVNMATYVGFHMYGLAGGLAATLSLVAPSIIVICIIAKILEKFRSSPIVNGVFEGLRPAVCGLIIAAVMSIYISALFNVSAWQATGNLLSLFNWKACVLFAALLAFYLYKPKIHPIVIICAAAAAGIIFGF